MYEIPNLIEDIRTGMAHSDLTAPDKLADYARRYAEECTKLNDRIKLCLPHLRNGNVAEAVRVAESPPNAIETYNLLDFENRQDWVEICDGLGLDVPPPLATEIFHELNDAYLQMAPLEPLLKWHRIHALNGAPIRDRLSVLRALVKADPMNLLWQTDQETFENARIKEIGQEVADARAKNDSLRLQELYQELADPDWRIPFPIEYRQITSVSVLEKQADELMKLCAALNYHGAFAAYQSMQQFLATNQMAMPAAIGNSIQSAVQWMQGTANAQQYYAMFQQAVTELQEALEEDLPRETLEALYSALKNSAAQANQVVPQELKQRYLNRIDYLKRYAEWQYWVKRAVLALAIAVLAIPVLTIFFLLISSFFR